jgi:hypothetical protein
MKTDFSLLFGIAGSTSFIRTVLGPDHYLPFVAMARSGNWSRRKRLWGAVPCVAGHVTGSVAI